MIMMEEDNEFKQKEERRLRRKQEEMQREEKVKSVPALKETLVSSSSSTISIEDDECEDHEQECEKTHEEMPISRYYNKTIEHSHLQHDETVPPLQPKLTKRRILEDPKFTASLDRTNTTYIEAMHIVTPALQAAGVDVSSVTLSTSSIYRARKKIRQSVPDTLKQNFVPDTLSHILMASYYRMLRAIFLIVCQLWCQVLM